MSDFINSTSEAIGSAGGLFISANLGCRLLARSCRSGMSAVWSLSGVNQTWSERSNPVEIHPIEISPMSASVFELLLRSGGFLL